MIFRRPARDASWTSRAIVVSMLLCSCGESAPPTTPDVPAEAPVAAPPEPPPPIPAAPATVEPTTTPTAPHAPLARDEADALRAALAQARRTAARDPAAALTAFEALVTDHPRDPRLHCEAGYVAHRAGRTDRAAELLGRGLGLFGSAYSIPAQLAAPYAMCLYNRGLVHEARGDVEAARSDYFQSLEARASAAVERRMRALPEPELPEITVAETLEALAASHAASGVDDLDGDGEGDEDYGTYAESAELLARRPASDGVPEVAILAVTTDEEMLSTTRVELAVRDGAGYRTFGLLEDWSDNTDHGNTDLGRFSDPSFEVVPTAAGPILLARVTNEHLSGSESCDDECCYVWSQRTPTVRAMICRFAPSLACRVLSLSAVRTDPADASDCEEEEGDGERGDGDDEDGAAADWSRTLTIDPDRTTHLRATLGHPPEPPSPGDRPLDALLGLLVSQE